MNLLKIARILLMFGAVVEDEQDLVDWHRASERSDSNETVDEIGTPNEPHEEIGVRTEIEKVPIPGPELQTSYMRMNSNSHEMITTTEPLQLSENAKEKPQLDSLTEILKDMALDGKSMEIRTTLDSLVTLAETLPLRGTNLDQLWANLLQALIQLVMAVNRGLAHYYIALSTKFVQHAAELVSTIESTEVGLFGDDCDSLLSSKINEMCKAVGIHFPKQLMLSSRISVIDGPSNDAVFLMLNDAIATATMCKDLTRVANAHGLFPVLQGAINVSVIGIN